MKRTFFSLVADFIFSAQFLSSFYQFYENCITSLAGSKIFAANMLRLEFCVIFF